MYGQLDIGHGSGFWMDGWLGPELSWCVAKTFVILKETFVRQLISGKETFVENHLPAWLLGLISSGFQITKWVLG